MHLSPVVRRRLLVAAAITLMVSSSVLSFFFVQENDRRIAELKQEEERKDESIRTLWGNAAEADHNADAAVIVSLLAKDATPENATLKHYYFTRVGAGEKAGSLMDVLKAAAATRTHAVDDVNDIYLSRIAVEREVDRRESNNKSIAAFAFLLQLMGLVLVILMGETHGV